MNGDEPTYWAFGDESGIHVKDSACYGIGALILPSSSLDDVRHEVQTAYSGFGVDRELKWTGVASHSRYRDAALCAAETALRVGASFQSIIVEKATYHLWNRGDPEEAFYKTYYQLAKSVASQFGAGLGLVIDDKSDRYPHRAEALTVITNRALAKIEAEGTIHATRKTDSKSEILLQVADVLIGAVTASTNLYLNPACPIHEGKLELIGQLAALVGWDRLCYDSWRNDKFNIWHFPLEFRNRPGSRNVRLGWRQVTSLPRKSE